MRSAPASGAPAPAGMPRRSLPAAVRCSASAARRKTPAAARSAAAARAPAAATHTRQDARPTAAAPTSRPSPERCPSTAHLRTDWRAGTAARPHPRRRTRRTAVSASVRATAGARRVAWMPGVDGSAASGSQRGCRLTGAAFRHQQGHDEGHQDRDDGGEAVAGERGPVQRGGNPRIRPRRPRVGGLTQRPDGIGGSAQWNRLIKCDREPTSSASRMADT